MAAVVGAGGGPEPGGAGSGRLGEFGEAGVQEPLRAAGEEQGVAQAGSVTW